MGDEDKKADCGWQERRKRQRFLARRDGTTCFWIVMDGTRHPLIDLSLEGFGFPGEAHDSVQRDFDFELQLEGIPDKIRGIARVMNHVPGEHGGQIGCCFVSFSGEGREDLLTWLTTHVIWSSSVRLSEKEAVAIVSGPSLV